MPAPNIMVRTPGPARPHRPTVAGVKGTPVPALHKNTPISTHKAHLAQYAPERSSPLVPPKTPATSRGGAPKTAGLQRGSKTMFGRLATDCSDDILDFEEKNSQLSPIDGTSPSEQPLAKSTGLGKRAKPSDAISPSGSQNNGRYAKRPVCATYCDISVYCLVNSACRGPREAVLLLRESVARTILRRSVVLLPAC